MTWTQKARPLDKLQFGYAMFQEDDPCEWSRTWLEAERPQVLPKSIVGQAFTYTPNQWQALRRYHAAT